jgi:RNA:NAD 2'-phosphotransferase (TPT1/KptA family)
MKVLVDENIPLITVEELRLKGFDVIDIRGSAEQGITDEVLWQKAQQEKRTCRWSILAVCACHDKGRYRMSPIFPE